MEVDRVTQSNLRRALAAREVLAGDLRSTPHDDPDFPALLREVYESKLFTGDELAALVGLGRTRFYEILRES
jgi:hypothetical protein